jgi:hypothetical protein
MDIRIAPEVRLNAVQAQFQKRFPFLRIEFFRSKPGTQISPTSRLSGEATFAEASTKQGSGQLHITGLTTVRQLEELLQSGFSIHAEVFRKSGKVWLRTSATDDWTLDEQNAKARESGTPEPEAHERPDYHEQD